MYTCMFENICIFLYIYIDFTTLILSIFDKIYIYKLDMFCVLRVRGLVKKKCFLRNPVLHKVKQLEFYIYIYIYIQHI